MQKKLQTRLLKQLKIQKLMTTAFGLLAFFFSLQVQAQTPLYFKTGTGTGGNTIPLNQASQKTQLLYTPTDFGTAPISGSITKIYFRNSAANATATYSNFKVSFLQNNDASIPSTSFYTGLTPVHFAASQTVNANATAGGWFEIPLQAPYFQYDNTKTLIIEIQYTSITGGISSTTTTSTGNKRVSGQSLTATTGTASTTWNDFGLDILAATPCSGAPTAGTATTNTANLCAGSDFTLNLSGVSSGTGLTFQWQTSPNGTTGWTPVGSASNTPILTSSQTSGPHYYQAIVTCGTQTATSSSVLVTSPALINGSFTINNNVPASATNFQTFTAAINSLTCGINGPVTFTVAATSGPYNEQIEIPEIAGASATNTITFQGNGRTISADPATGNRAIIKLDGADYVTINNLNIVTTGTSTTAYGWGIHFINGADNNTISNNTISIGSLSITASNSVGIVFANSASTATTVGNNGNNNLIIGNTITGGYRGIRLNGTATGVGNNQITNNTIKDFYTGGIEIDDANATKIEGNDISRPTRLVVTAFDGIALTGTTINSIINKNRIHNSHGAATTLTSTAYGISSTSNDAAVGSENIVKNNLIYDLNNTGTANGIHNTGSNGIFYYNNTINLDNAASTAISRGFYQTTAASNIKFINNNVVVSNGGVATNQHAIYLNNATSTVESNRNNLFAPTGNIGFYNANSYATLASWQAANTTAPFDLNSVSADPFFVSAATGNLAPTNGVLNNVGQALAAVTDDFTGALRNATTPDIGAYEFTPSALDLGVTALVTPAPKNCFSNAEPVTVTITNFGTSAINFSTITANVTVNVTGAATPAPLTVVLTNTMNGGQPLAPAASMNVLVGNVNMATAGTYTFNAATAVTAGGTDGTASNNAMPATDITVSPLAAGTAATTNANLCVSGITTLNLTGNTGGAIQWQSGTSATGPFTDITGATSASYTLATPITQTTYYKAVVACGTNNASSNVLTVTVQIPTAPTVAAVSRCGAGPVTLTTTVPAGTPVNWYDAATGGAPVASGATYSPNITATTTFYATVGGTTANVGPTSNAIGATSGSATATYYQIFDVLTPLTLNSVYVYPVAAGNVNLHISNSAGTVLQSISVPVTAADVNQKTLIPINYFLPVGTAYRIGWATGGVSLLRNSAGATYPYTVPGVISVTGNSFTSGANYWYAVYDWSVSSGCESARTPVVATVTPLPATPSVTRAGNVLTSSAATGNQWYLDGTLIPGATGQTHTATASGTYTVTTTVNNCTSAASTGVAFVLGVNSELAGMSVDVYPNPATGSFNVKLTGYQKDANVVLYNLAGQRIATEKVSADGNAKNISLKGLAAGTYLLKVTSEKGVQVNRLIVQ